LLVAAAPALPLPLRGQAPLAAPEKSSGFNSFMAEGLLGWKQELLSLRLRQAVAASARVAQALPRAIGPWVAHWVFARHAVASPASCTP
jgi:hypothetical protein